jgi:TfoX/Sxy family transcriptional regulator of competence genes
MSSKQSTVDFILEQLSGLGNIRTRKMFGDYALYCDEKVIGLICDDQLFIKYTIPGKQFAEGRYMEGCAYKGAKPSMNISESIDDRDFLAHLVRLTAGALPLSLKRIKTIKK